jgi:hypothetical protein
MTTATPPQQPSHDRRHETAHRQTREYSQTRDCRSGSARPYADALARIAAGDGTALAALYDDFAEVVLSLARQQLHRAADAGPITDAVFLEIRWLAALPPSTVPPSTGRGVLAWILDIAHRRIHDRNHPAAPHHALPNLFDHDAHTHQELSTFLRTGAPAITPPPGLLRRRGTPYPATPPPHP